MLRKLRHSTLSWFLFLADVALADVRYVIPNLARWLFRTRIRSMIPSYGLQSANDTKAAHLFIHTRLNQGDAVVLLLHGDFGHPYASLHLADWVSQEGKTVFSLRLHYSDKDPDRHRRQLELALDKITELTGHTKCMLIGHSRGAIEAAYLAYVKKDPRISGVISIAGRLRLLETSRFPCRAALQPTVASIWEMIAGKAPTTPLYQVAATQDQVIDLAAAVVRPENRLEVNTGHTRVLYHPETLRQISIWIRESQ